MREKLTWIEVRGVPDYLDSPTLEAVLPDGRTFIAYPTSQGYRDEVQQVYRAAFNESDLGSQTKILRSYTAHAPHLAFDPDGWLWPLWQEWRARRNSGDRRLLAAMASGIKAKGWAGMTATRSRAWRLAQAKRRLIDLKADQNLRRLYGECLRGVRSRNVEVRAETKRRYLERLIALIDQKMGYRTSLTELERKKLSGVLLLAVSRRFGVRERDLH